MENLGSDEEAEVEAKGAEDVNMADAGTENANVAAIQRDEEMGEAPPTDGQERVNYEQQMAAMLADEMKVRIGGEYVPDEPPMGAYGSAALAGQKRQRKELGEEEDEDMDFDEIQKNTTIGNL